MVDVDHRRRAAILADGDGDTRNRHRRGPRDCGGRRGSDQQRRRTLLESADRNPWRTGRRREAAVRRTGGYGDRRRTPACSEREETAIDGERARRRLLRDTDGAALLIEIDDQCPRWAVAWLCCDDEVD